MDTEVMNALTAIRTKRDTRGFDPTPVDESVIHRVLDAARMAGSAKNVQPVRVVLVDDEETKVALKAGGDFAVWIDQAPHLAVFTASMDAGPRRMFDIGRHAQNLMIAATAEGLASCPVTLHHQDVVREILHIPADVDAPMLVAFGRYVSVDTPPSIAGPRVSLDSYVHRGRWRAS